MSDEQQPPNNGRAKLPPEVLEAMAKFTPWLQAAGIEVPREMETAVPQLYLGDRVGVLAHQLSQNLRGSGLYRAGEELVTVDESDGKFRLMTPKRSVAWLDSWVSFWKTVHGEKKFVSINRQKAEEILASDAFLCKIPQLNGINPVKLPVRRRTGELELLQPGYDAESGIFTLHSGIDYEEDMDPDEARAYLLKLLQYFPFGDTGRSQAVHVAAMLTMYCIGMLPKDARPPIFIWNANQVGSGKTRLAQMALIPVFGTADVATWWERVEEFKKELDSAAQAFAPYLFFDDQGGRLKNNLLNAWVTSSRWGGRIMGGKERFSVPLRAATLVTGNHLTYSDDILRRSLICQLFSPVQYDQRVLPDDAIELTEEWLLEDSNRRRHLSALWAMTKHAEAMQTLKPVKPARKVGNFEAWSRVVPRIVMHAQFGDPTELPPAAEANPLLQDARELTRRALDELVEGRNLHTVKLADLVPIARRHGLFVEKLGTLDDVFRDLDAGRNKWKQVEVVETDVLGKVDIVKRDPTPAEKREQAAAWIDRSMATSFGGLIKKLVTGLQFPDSAGRLYEFGSREGSRQSTYVCTRQGLTAG